ncbi:MAG: ribosome recycling factor, ribosome recycling factor [Candidatus Gottesmanbacteria bacterium GW2011_GWA2_43_14]|uniref:Ribosome-recycling factor n=1 Tax=Candidatus Gottesmanbacteria bacterium GW2011_GWA2_43_14 TaxID=1618443 RepID=A0A0G1GFH4_9BACT|nr:MAG: ribosome recycling factor, ribosome recycling factor [Candidatus Gottesmanbacteria bacterium GW2011_GWA2_43_14]
MEEPLITETRARMQKALQVLADDLGTIRTGRATPALVENVVISAYEGTQNLKLREMATITTEGPRTVLIAPFDPSVIRDIEKGINSANLGFTAAPDGNILRINIPALTSDRRVEFIKLAGTKIEGGRVLVRQVRHDVMSNIKRSFEAKELSEDDKKRLEKEIQDLTDNMMEEIEAMRHKKEEELQQV